MASGSNQVSPLTAIVAVVVVLIAAVAGGIWYMNRPHSDEIAAAVSRQRGGTAAPLPADAPYGGVPPVAGKSDYQRAAPMPNVQPVRH